MLLGLIIIKYIFITQLYIVIHLSLLSISITKYTIKGGGGGSAENDLLLTLQENINRTELHCKKTKST